MFEAFEELEARVSRETAAMLRKEALLREEMTTVSKATFPSPAVHPTFSFGVPPAIPIAPASAARPAPPNPCPLYTSDAARE